MRLHDEGNRLPKLTSGSRYAEVLGLALRQEFADQRFKVKTIGRWTQASERTIKNWFSGISLPNSKYLIRLIARSDAALEMVLAASRRTELLAAFSIMTRRGGARSIIGTKDGTIRDTKRGTSDGTVFNAGRSATCHERHTWFVAELLAGSSPGLTALQERFGVSIRTAKRDVATLRINGTIRYEGTNRNGRYVITPPKG